MEYILERTQTLHVSIEDAFGFFSQAGNLEEITPSWLRFEVLRAPDELRYGSLLAYRLELFRVPIHWLSRISHSPAPRSTGCRESQHGIRPEASRTSRSPAPIRSGSTRTASRPWTAAPR